ncbi:MAG: ClpXP protease specificity-enhancing factor [Burkholderiaceae bacterium]|nr:ClpXP protease specificity-enhancing factor [Burkholderiaceae bacterium]
MISTSESTSTRPYLIRALHEWCTDNGLTPYITVQVDESTQVPKEHVKNKEIVLNVSFDATSGLKLGNDYIEFKGRFSGIARDIIVPVNRVIAIFARENSQGMAFPNLSQGDTLDGHDVGANLPASPETADNLADASNKVNKLVSVDNSTSSTLERGQAPDDNHPKPPAGSRPNLKRVK